MFFLLYIVILSYFSRVLFILTHYLTNNIYLAVFENIYLSVFVLSVFIYLFMYLFMYLLLLSSNNYNFLGRPH